MSIPRPCLPRTFFLLCILCLLAASSLPLRAAPPEDRPLNVLFIATDDLNGALGFMGDPVAKTPHIDRLAQSGIAFTRAYCQQPLCNPSRASMLTGLRPDTIEVWDLRANFRDTTGDSQRGLAARRVTPLPELFKQQDYFSARVGKIYHYGVPRQIGSGGSDDANSWDLAINPRGRDKDEEDNLHVLTLGTGSTLGFAMAWLDMEGTDEEQTDGIGIDETIGVLERYGKQHPMWMGMGFFRPHTPFVATKKWFEVYPKQDLNLPPRPAGDLDDIPPIALKIDPPDYGLSESDQLDSIRAYYASVSFIDDQVGKLIGELERLDMIDNTIIVFFSDHGFLLGEHHQWQKQMLFEEAARVPLIIVPPGGLRNPKQNEADWKSERVVELLDVYPTLVAMAGVEAPPQILEGRDLSPLLENPQAEWDHPALTQSVRRVDGKRVMAYSIRNERWRYTEWGEDGEYGTELYDHDNDPREHTNLATSEDSQHEDVVRELKAQMEAIKARSQELRRGIVTVKHE